MFNTDRFNLLKVGLIPTGYLWSPQTRPMLCSLAVTGITESSPFHYMCPSSIRCADKNVITFRTIPCLNFPMIVCLGSFHQRTEQMRSFCLLFNCSIHWNTITVRTPSIGQEKHLINGLARTLHLLLTLCTHLSPWLPQRYDHIQVFHSV